MSTAVIVAIIGASATLGAAVISVIWNKKHTAEAESVSSSKEARAKNQYRFDIFISAPLAGLSTDEAISADHEQIARVVALLEGQFDFSVFWAGRNIQRKADFEAADLSAKNDIAAILDSKYFLLVYPDKIASSVLFEAGIALRGCLTSIYFVRDRAHLPFLMTQASQAFANVRTYEGAMPEALVRLLQKHGKAFFEPLRAA